MISNGYLLSRDDVQRLLCGDTEDQSSDNERSLWNIVHHSEWYSLTSIALYWVNTCETLRLWVTMLVGLLALIVLLPRAWAFLSINNIFVLDKSPELLESPKACTTRISVQWQCAWCTNGQSADNSIPNVRTDNVRYIKIQRLELWLVHPKWGGSWRNIRKSVIRMLWYNLIFMET